RDSTHSRCWERNNCSGKPRRGPGSRARSLKFWIWPDMNWNEIRLRLRALCQDNRVEDELEEEIKTHLERCLHGDRWTRPLPCRVRSLWCALVLSLPANAGDRDQNGGTLEVQSRVWC